MPRLLVQAPVERVEPTFASDGTQASPPAVKKIMKNINLPNWLTYGPLFIAAFLFVFLFSCTTSPLYEHYPFWFHGDSGIFQEMGVCLLQGGTPYVDLFDHKGPVLWFIQALGIGLSPRWGLMALQSISLFCTLLLWYKSSLLLVERQIPAIIITLSGLIFLLAFYERGNLCEEWSLPFISLPIYLYIKRSGKQPVGTQASRLRSAAGEAPAYRHTDAFIVGLSVGIIAMIRLNNTAPIVGFVLWHFIECLKNKDFRRLWTDIALICGGIATIIVLCASFYLRKAGWNGVFEMIYGNFIFNFTYFSSINDSSGFAFHLYITPIVFIVISFICVFNRHDSTTVSIPLIISFIVTLLALGRSFFYHYFIVFVPLFVLTTIQIVHNKANIAYIIWGALSVYSVHIGYDAIDHLAFRLLGKKANTELNDGFHHFIASVPDDELKSIYNGGLSCMGAGLFADENIYQCNRIIYTTHLDHSNRLREYETTHGIDALQPVWILTQTPRPEATDDYMATHYTLSDSIPGGEFDPIWCWKRTEKQ